MTSSALRDLTLATQRTSEGEWRKNPIKWNYSTEIIELTKNFNKMVERLKRQRSENEDLTKMKSQFLTVISHIFRTPLNVLSWNSEALWEDLEESDDISDEHKENIKAIDTATDRMNITFQNIFNALEIQQKTI